MDPLGILAKFGAGTLLAGSCFLLAVSVYHVREAIRAWIDARAKGLTEERARVVGETAGQTINGKIGELVDARVANQLRGVNARIAGVNARIAELWDTLEEHRKEDAEAHVKIKALEVEMTSVKASIVRVENRLDERCDKLEEIQREEQAHTRRSIADSTTSTSVKLEDVLKAIREEAARRAKEKS